MAKSPKRHKSHQCGVAALAAKQREEQEPVPFWWACLSNPAPKLKKERNSCVQGGKSFSEQERQGCRVPRGPKPAAVPCGMAFPVGS